MTGQRTAPSLILTERTKARVRLPLLILATLVGPPLAGMRFTPVWLIYILFGFVYALWALRLTQLFSADNRLGYLLCLTDSALLLPLAAWSTGLGMKVAVPVVCALGLAVTYVVDEARLTRGRRTDPVGGRRPSSGSGRVADPEAELRAAIGSRLRSFQHDGSRFGLVVLRLVRFEETNTYYGDETGERALSAVGRRGMRLLGQEAQRFVLRGGRVAFLFETAGPGGRTTARERLDWHDSYDTEGLAMVLGRRVCENLVEGRRLECVVGWSSAPADGLSTGDLLSAALAGAQSTEAFRRVGGIPGPGRPGAVDDRRQAAAG
jgi:GGDEF domain-containing protein